MAGVVRYWRSGIQPDKVLKRHFPADKKAVTRNSIWAASNFAFYIVTHSFRHSDDVFSIFMDLEFEFEFEPVTHNS